MSFFKKYVNASSKRKHITGISMIVIIGSWSLKWANGLGFVYCIGRLHRCKELVAAKLGPKFYGPFMVLERVRTVAYKLQLPSGAKLHNVFHVGLLKKYHGPTREGPGILPPIRHGRACLEPAEVTWCRRARGREEVLVS
jgi:hypothetical protein